MTNREPLSPAKVLIWCAVCLLVLVLVTGIGVGGCAGVKAFNRAQARANANNQVSITHILIRKAQQQADINHAEIQATIAEAQKRYEGLAQRLAKRLRARFSAGRVRAGTSPQGQEGLTPWSSSIGSSHVGAPSWV